MGNLTCENGKGSLASHDPPSASVNDKEEVRTATDTEKSVEEEVGTDPESHRYSCKRYRQDSPSADQFLSCRSTRMGSEVQNPQRPTIPSEDSSRIP